MSTIHYERPKITVYQKAALFHKERYGFIEGTTKSGKTHGGMLWLLEQAMTGKALNYYWVAPVYGQAKIAYSRLKNAIQEDQRKSNESDLSITLPNQHILWFKSAEKPDNLFGDNVGAALIDEASRTREESFHAVRSTLTATRGPLRCIGNVKGRKNWFFKLCRRAEAGEKNMIYAKVTAADAVKAGILAQDEIDDAKRLLPESVFNELYLAIPSEDGSNPFGMKHILACVAALSSASPVCFGFDLAKAVDWTVGVGLDKRAHVSSFERFQKPWEDAYKAIYEQTDASRAPALVDSTGIGDPILSRLQKDRPRRFEGYKFTSESKQKLMEGLAVAIQSGRVGFPDGVIRTELENFEYEYTRTGVRYSAPEGMHDDCVMALALAVSIHTNKVSNKAGRIFSNWSEANELDALPSYHQDCWNKGRVAISHSMGPSDRRPWAMVWFATFPNDDSIAFAEWPGFDLHSATTSPLSAAEDFREMILETEANFGGKDVRRGGRIGSPDWFGDEPGSMKHQFSRPCAACFAKHKREDVYQKCAHRLSYRAAPDPAPVNHTVMRAAIGDAESKVRPKHYAMKDACPNYCYAIRNYEYSPEARNGDDPSEKPRKRDQGMADVGRLFFNAKLDKWPKESEPFVIDPPRSRGRGTPNT